MLELLALIWWIISKQISEICRREYVHAVAFFVVVVFICNSQIHGAELNEMSLLGGYKKKTCSYDGYESLQLVDSSGNFNNGGGRGSGIGGGSVAATLGGPKAGPLCEDDCSTMDSSGKQLSRHGRRCGSRAASKAKLGIMQICCMRGRARLSLCDTP